MCRFSIVVKIQLFKVGLSGLDFCLWGWMKSEIYKKKIVNTREELVTRIHNHGTRREYAPAALYPPERPSTHCTGGWVGPRAGLDRCRKSRPHQDSIPGKSNP